MMPAIIGARIWVLLGALVVVGATGCGPFGSPDTDPRDPGALVAPTPAPTATPSTPTDPVADEQGVAVVQWIAYRQRNLAFFEVYRATSPESPRQLLTRGDDVILGEGDSDQSLTYSYVDRDVVPGKPYYYTIGQVDVTGRRSPFTRRPIRKMAMTREAFVAEFGADFSTGAVATEE
jgi:hypothetical protein